MTAAYSHIAVKPIGRSAGAGVVGRAAYQSGTRGVVASAAYRAGERLAEQSSDHIFDYTNKRGIHAAYLMLPEDAPTWASDRQKLWNEADQVPGRKDARIATEIEFSLPKELSWAQRRELVDNLFRPLVERHHIAVDIALHTGADPRNVHCHAITSHRELGPDGFGDIACRHTIVRKVKGQQREVEVAGITAMPSDVERLRRLLDKHTNDAFRRAGLDLTVDSRSYERQGNGLTPTLPLGPERKGDTEREQRAEYNNRVMAERAERERQALDRAVERSHPSTERETADAKAKWEAERTAEAEAKARKAETDAPFRELQERNLAAYRARKQAEASQEVEKHGGRLAQEDSAFRQARDSPKPASRSDRPLAHLSAEELEKKAHAAWTPSWSEPLNVEGVARELSLEYRDQANRLNAVNRDVERARWNRQHLDWEKEAALGRIDERRQEMTWLDTLKNVFNKDPELAHWRDVHDRSVISDKQAARKEWALIKEQAKATRDANRAYDRIKPVAAEELVKRLERQAAAEEEKRIRAAIERSGEVQSRPMAREQHQAHDRQLKDRLEVPSDPAQARLENEQRSAQWAHDKAIVREAMARTDPATREQRAGDFYRQKINAARAMRRAGAEAYVQATLAEGRIANTAKHAPGTEQGATGASVKNIRQLHEDARLDITNYRPTTVEDIARELSPAFAGADDRVKALRQAQVNLNNLIDATDNSRYLIQREHEQRQRQMSGLRTVLDRYGPLRDRQLFDLEERMGQLSAEHEALIMRTPALGHDVSAAEHIRTAELEKIRNPAERELADRQQRAAAARAELAAQRARELAIERAEREAERQQYRQSHQHRRGLSLGR